MLEVGLFDMPSDFGGEGFHVRYQSIMACLPAFCLALLLVLLHDGDILRLGVPYSVTPGIFPTCLVLPVPNSRATQYPEVILSEGHLTGV